MTMSEADEFGPAETTHAPDADVLHLGCGEDHHHDAHNVDAVAGVDPDEVVDLDERPWPWPDETFHHVRANHVLEHLADMEGALRECARVLSPGGVAVVTLPMGLDARADPDHTWGHRGEPWTWRTPVFLTGDRHWDRDVGLVVETREVTVWSHAPERPLAGVKTEWWTWRLDRYGAGAWCFGLAGMSGEFTVVFRKP